MKKSINYSYFVAAGCMLVGMGAGVSNESILRAVANSGISYLIILLMRQSVYVLLNVLVMVVRKINDPRVHIFPRSKYLPMHLLRGGLFLIGSNCWATAITWQDSSVPLYLVYYVALMIPTLNIVFSQVLLGEKVGFIVNFLSISSMLPIVYYLLSGKFVFPVLLLVFGCTFYSLLDCINAYITNKEPRGLMGKVFPHKGPEPGASNNFYNALVINFLYLGTALVSLGPSRIGEQLMQITQSSSTVLSLLLMGILSFISFIFPLQALKRVSLSSLQPFKILEPMMAGVFFDHKSIPLEILVALSLFLGSSAVGFANGVSKK